mmetsp:Transcript_24342/g.71467  ORF Transcript_24342/g.71467 Transcript_24342/m.71467 type:complete len:213 (-) Transcript_24342:355-993(-)
MPQPSSPLSLALPRPPNRPASSRRMAGACAWPDPGLAAPSSGLLPPAAAAAVLRCTGSAAVHYPLCCGCTWTWRSTQRCGGGTEQVSRPGTSCKEVARPRWTRLVPSRPRQSPSMAFPTRPRRTRHAPCRPDQPKLQGPTTASPPWFAPQAADSGACAPWLGREGPQRGVQPSVGDSCSCREIDHRRRSRRLWKAVQGRPPRRERGGMQSSQ